MQSKVEQQVMASVAVIYAVRKLLSRTALEVYILVASAITLWRLIWVHKVFDNFFAIEQKGLGAISNYLLVAVTHTNLAVQLTLLIAACAFVALCIDAARSFTEHELAF